MAIARVAGVVSAQSVNGTTTSSIDTTGATLIVVAVATLSTTASPMSDSKGNSWTRLRQRASGGEATLEVWYSVPTTVGSGHTFTYSVSNMFGAFVVLAFSGTAASSPADQTNANNATGTTSIQPGSITPSEDGEVVISGKASLQGGSTWSIDESYTIEGQLGGGGYEGVALAYKIQTTATATNPTWSNATSSDVAVSSDSFKAAAAAPTTYPSRLLLLGVG